MPSFLSVQKRQNFLLKKGFFFLSPPCPSGFLVLLSSLFIHSSRIPEFRGDHLDMSSSSAFGGLPGTLIESPNHMELLTVLNKIGFRQSPNGHDVDQSP